MSTNTNRRISTLWIMVVSLVFLLAATACSGGNSGNNGNSGNSGNQTANTPETGSSSGNAPKEGVDAGTGDQGYTLPIVSDGSVELTVATFDNWYAPASYTQNLPVFQEIENITGVKIKWDVAPAAQYNEAISTRLSAGRDLPDIISLPADPVKPALDGLIIPLRELIEQHAPNIRELFRQSPNLATVMTAPDGEIYGLSSVVTGTTFSDPYGLLIRQDWLEKLGLEEPRTLDEWYTVLKAFKEKDPNGNGQQDEIPLSPIYGIWGITGFASGVGLNLNFSDGYYPDADGNIQYQWSSAQAHEFVVWLNKLYEEGLLDLQFMTNTPEQVDAGIARDLVGVTNHFINNTVRFNSALNQAGVPSANWQIALPPAVEGQKGFYEKYGPISGWFGISKDAKHPEIAIQWLDYVYAGEEGNRFLTFGIEGQSYEMIGGEPEFTEWAYKNPDGLSLNDALRSLGALPNIPYVREESGPLSKQPLATIKNDPYLKAQAEKVKDYFVDSSQFMLTLPSPEESARLTEMMADFATYKNETLAKFITGQSPIEWDAFVETLQSLGLDDILAIKQVQYDRGRQ